MPRKRDGFVLLASALIMLALAGVAGLSIDISHLYAVRAEAQSFADSLALTAARELDGSSRGIERARQRIMAIPRTGYLKVVVPSRVETDFSRDGKSWEKAPSRAEGLVSVRVRVSLDSVALFFLPAVIPHRTAAVHVVSVAEQESAGSDAPPDLLPYAIYARSDRKPDFGYREGDPVTLRWSSSGAGCGRSVPRGGAAGDGYTDGMSRDRIREAIEDGRLRSPARAGKQVRMVQADIAQQASSLVARANQDTNSTAARWTQYRSSPGNGRRTPAVSVISEDKKVLGFVSVFLPSKQSSDNGEPLCAEFAGTPSEPAQHFARLVR
jgi:hypothetical protein